MRTHMHTNNHYTQMTLPPIYSPWWCTHTHKVATTSLRPKCLPVVEHEPARKAECIPPPTYDWPPEAFGECVVCVRIWLCRKCAYTEQESSSSQFVQPLDSDKVGEIGAGNGCCGGESSKVSAIGCSDGGMFQTINIGPNLLQRIPNQNTPKLLMMRGWAIN
jgi:hypothetical protein